MLTEVNDTYSQGGYGGGSNNAYGGQQQPQQQSVGYSGGGGYGSQQGYTQSYPGYESYQQAPDYSQTTVSELSSCLRKNFVFREI